MAAMPYVEGARWPLGYAPRRFCVVCGQILVPPGIAPGRKGLYSACEVTGGAAVSFSCPNRWCQRADRGFSVVFSVGAYKDGLRRAITRYKYHRQIGLARALAGSLARHVESNPTWYEDFDLVTSVPTYHGPGARRDWDPLAGILESLSRRLGPRWDVVADVVSKSFETPGMTGLSWADRQVVASGPLRRALIVPEAAVVQAAKVLVIDDVFTDGSTLREVALALLGSGAAEVAGLVIARKEWSAVRPCAGLTCGP